MIIVCDLDGVLADSSVRIKKAIQPDGSIDPELIDVNILGDTPKTDVIKAVARLADWSGTPVEIWTARPVRTEPDTAAWLKLHDISYARLRMADEFTNLANAVSLKRGWVQEVGAANICLAIDDRIEMIRMYEEEGVRAILYESLN